MVCKSDDWLSLWMTEHLAWPLQHATVSTVLRWWRPLICAALSSCGSARLQFNTRVSTTSGNVLEFEILSGNTGHLLEFTCSSWKFLYNRLVIDDCLAVIQLLGNWLAQFINFLSASLYFSKRGAYWDRLCRDVVGRWLSRVCTGQTVHPRPIVTMEH